MHTSSRNIAGRLAESFITSKLTSIFVISCLIVGVFAVYLTPREETPQIVVPCIRVQTTFPGATSTEVEHLIIQPLEGELQKMTGVDHTYSISMNSVGIINVQFETGEDKEDSLVKVYNCIKGRKHPLPIGSSEPIIQSIDVDDIPIVTITLASDKLDDYALKHLAEQIKLKLRSLPNVSDTYVKGGRNRELRIEIDPEKLQSYGTTLDQVRNIITAANISSPIGNVVKENESRNMFLNGFIINADDLSNLVISIHNNRPIYLKDIAKVVDGPPTNRNSFSLFGYGPGEKNSLRRDVKNDMPSVTLAIAKKQGSNAVTVANEIIERLRLMQQEFISDDVEVVVTRNDGKKANDAVNHLIKHLGVAILCVFLVTTLFLGIKEGLIVGFTVPLILSLTIAADYICGPTINRVTLYSLILVLGMAVDAAIVVIENIHRQYSISRNANKRTITINATNEIGNPTNLATLAVMLVFISMIMLTGMPLQFFKPAIFNVPVSMALSVIVAYIVVPWAANKWVNSDTKHEKKSIVTDKIISFFHTLLIPVLEKRKYRLWAVTIAIIAILLSLLLPTWQFVRPIGIEGPQSWFGVEMAMLPKDNKNTFNITIDTSETTPIEVTTQLTRKISNYVKTIPEVKNYVIWIGQSGIPDISAFIKGSDIKQGSNIAEIRVNLTDKKHRKKSSIELVREIRPHIQELAKEFPQTTIQLVEDPPGPPVMSTVRAEIYGDNLNTIRKVSSFVKDEFQKTYDIVETSDTEVEDVFRYELTPIKEKAALSGITTAEIAVAVNRLIDGETLGVAHIENENNPVLIRFEVPRKFQIMPETLNRILLTNKQGKKIPLSSLVQIKETKVDHPIYHKDNERVSIIGGEMGKSSPVYAVMALNHKIKGKKLNDGTMISTGNLQLSDDIPDSLHGTRILWDGEMRMTLDIYRELLTALGLSLSLIFVILIVYYQSFTIPLIAMSSIPLGLAGVFPGHLLMNTQFSATSIVGILALAGVVVRNSLLLIDFTFQNMNKGKSIKEATIQAVDARVRPILLTALAIILGNVIMLKDPVFSGMAISLIFGTIVSTIFTLIIVPLLLFWAFCNNEN